MIRRQSYGCLKQGSREVGSEEEGLDLRVISKLGPNKWMHVRV